MFPIFCGAHRFSGGRFFHVQGRIFCLTLYESARRSIFYFHKQEVDRMKQPSRFPLRALLVCLAVPLAVGGLAALAAGSFSRYDALAKPPLSPPAWVFPAAWSVLFLLMGAGSFLVWRAARSQKRSRALFLYAVQLAVNFLWPVVFFRFGQLSASFFVLVVLWLLVLAMIGRFSDVSRAAAWMQLPYLLWLTFAAYLNFGMWFLNH
jgi:tryptophan-rich sensory protein